MYHRMRATNQFTSKTQGMNTRKSNWACVDCSQTWSIKEKRCPACGSKNFNYFPSDLEFKRYLQLRLLLRTGQINSLELHPSYKIAINGMKICKYVADFRYVRDGQKIVEDTKGFDTDIGIIKRKLVLALYGVDVQILKKV